MIEHNIRRILMGFGGGRLTSDTESASNALNVMISGFVPVDCASLEYISTAGLRVLMIMAKQYPEKVQLKNVQIHNLRRKENGEKIYADIIYASYLRIFICRLR